MARTKTGPPLPARRGGLAILCLSAALVAAGCKDDVVARYQVPKGPKAAQRLLGAIVPHAGKTWFFKLLGPQAAVDKHAEEFDRFVRTLRFKDKEDEPIAWTVPRGWQEKGKSDLRYATFVLGPPASPLELTVIPLGAEAGSLLANVNRWRGQMGLPDVDDDELAKLTREIKVDGKAVTLVDMKAEGADEAAFAAPEDPPPGAGPGEPTYTVPKGWEKASKPVTFSVATFEAGEGEQKAVVSFTPLSGPAGGLVPNVNRWREQVGLKRVGEDELKKGLRKIEVGGAAAQYADLSGPESDGAKRPRILGVVVPRGGHTWFIKMTGPADLVGEQKPAFEEFVKSVRFDKDSGAKP